MEATQPVAALKFRRLSLSFQGTYVGTFGFNDDWFGVSLEYA